MNKDYSSKDSQTDWEDLEKMDDSQIDLSDIPEITQEQLKKSVYRVGGKRGKKEKVRVTMYLDLEVVEYFKSLAGGHGYQTLINSALKESIKTEELEDTIRRVIREEMGAYK